MEMRKTEKAMKAYHDYIEELGDKVTDDNIEEYSRKFMEEYNKKILMQREGKFELTDEEKAYDLFEQAMESYSTSEIRKLLKQALRLYPNFTDAKMELVLLLEDEFKRLKELEKLEKLEKEYLENEGYFIEDNISHFYGILETRPYIRLVYSIASLYQEMGSYRKAIELYENIIELNENDNMGARYSLMGLYAMLEEPDKMFAIIERYPEDSVPTHLFQFVLAYKQLDYTKARRHLRAIQSHVPEFKHFIHGQIDEDDMEKEEVPGYYHAYSLEEIIMYMREFHTLFFNESILNFMHKTFK